MRVRYTINLPLPMDITTDLDAIKTNDIGLVVLENDVRHLISKFKVE